MEAFYWSTHEARFQFTVTNLGTTELEHNTGPEVYLLGPTGPLLFFLPTILVSSRKKFVCHRPFTVLFADNSCKFTKEICVSMEAF